MAFLEYRPPWRMDWLLQKPGPKVMHIGLTSSVSQDRAPPPLRGPNTCKIPQVTIPGYEIGAAIHQSRLRSVHRATRLADGLPVVIKTLNAEYPSKQDVAGLRREFHIIQAATVRRGRHPCARARAVRQWQCRASCSSRSVVPWRIRSRRRAIGAFSLERFFAIAIAVAETLGRVHELDVVHKNIEPRSILIDDSGGVRLIDFSISSELSLERQTTPGPSGSKALCPTSRPSRPAG